MFLTYVQPPEERALKGELLSCRGNAIRWNHALYIGTVPSGSGVNSQQDRGVPELMSYLWLFENTITTHHVNINHF